MRATLCVLLAATCVLADESRGSKRPYIADAVGNTLPPPSNGPATVGSPVNLLTPDRYEFYTFDESGELVKRLMTLQEIQAIVAAGEEAEGLVTFANDNQPTIAFNFSQPPYTKVHSVVTNVQNVLKAQMEAHKNKPQLNPTLDTPDVSDSWSLILPSIFGNTGVDIVPDKTSASFTTPETETIEFDRINFDDNLSKEGSNPIGSSTTVQNVAKPSITEKISSTTELFKEVPTTAKTTTTTTSTTTPKPTTTSTTTTPKPTTTTTTTKKPTTTTTTTTSTPTTPKPKITTTTTTRKPTTTTTVKPRTTLTTRRTTTTTTTSKPRTTASTTKLTTTSKPTAKITSKPTTAKPIFTTQRQVATSTLKNTESPSTKIQTSTHATSTTEKTSPVYEKISTFVPISTAAYVTERSTRKPTQTTKFVSTSESTTQPPVSSTSKLKESTTLEAETQPTITTYKPTTSTPVPVSSTVKSGELEKDDASTITTQSVSPSTAISSTEFMSVENQPPQTINDNISISEDNDIKVNEPIIPLFDVAQSISQIASDLGSANYQPIPTTSGLLDTTHAMNMDLESKESLELDIPSESKNESQNKTADIQNENDNFVKISTINPHQQNNNPPLKVKETINKVSNPVSKTTVGLETTTSTSTETPMDPILSESMDDLLSQVVNQAPQSIVDSENKLQESNVISTAENFVDTTTVVITTKTEIISQESTKNDMSSTTELALVDTTINQNLIKNETNDDVTEKGDNKKDTITQTENTVNANSVSATQNDLTKISSSNSTEKPSNPINSHGIQTLSVDKQNNVIAVINAPGLPMKEQITPSSTETVSPQEVSHKAGSENQNKINDKVRDDHKEETVSLPKVDEFKKKIQKVNIDYKEIANERNNSWKLISTVAPPKANEIPKDKFKTDGNNPESPDKDIVLDVSKENQGLEVTTKDLSDDVAQFTELCNELAFRYWNAIAETIPNKRSFILSPFSITSMLAMMFMGARGATSGEMNEILKLDDMVTFNPHFTLKNISDSIETTPESGVAISAFIRELYSDRNKGQILTFYKERAQHFYNGHVEEINFKLISDIIRRRTNLLVKRYTWGKIIEYMKANTITMQPPLAAFSTNIFETDCTGSSVEGRDGEMYFVVSPNVRQRRLVPVPAVLYKKGFLAGYDPVLDATAAALGNTNSIISTLFLMPGQQGNVVHAEDLELLEKRLLDSNPSTPAWNRLLRTLLPRIGLELQIPRFSHKSIFNVSSTLKKMGLKDLFDAEHADLGGLNGPSKDLYLSDMVQATTFVTCGEGIIGEQHHIEEYPESIELARRRRTSRWATGWDEPRDYQRAFHDPHDVGDAMNLPLHLRPRQARLPARNAQPARLKFDRPFLYFVRHNPSGMILYVGRYNPRLLP
ncbi:mucin-2 [Cydia pomonella]|uniref:mucin-2 n=1 Tax=Cydia pomonella TaxID=82600 RepID=UPI002ADE1D1D|nr:mucin-2 [Cydia pomonella]